MPSQYKMRQLEERVKAIESQAKFIINGLNLPYELVGMESYVKELIQMTQSLKTFTEIELEWLN